MSSFRDTLKEELNLFLDESLTLDRLQEEIQSIKERKLTHEKNIIKLLKNNNQENKTFLSNNVKVQHKSYLNYQQLSLKFLETCLREYNAAHHVCLNIDEMLEFIRNKRDKKQKEELKIVNT